MKKLFVLLLIALVLGAAAYFLYPKLFPKPAIKVLETAMVERGDIKAVLVETGIIKPQVGAEVKIGARATGVIEEMKVKIGDRVKKGELIALIDDREIRDQINQQRAALVAARKNAEQISSTYPEQIKQAKADYEYRKISYDREQKLIKNDYTTQDSVDLAKSLLEAAEAKLKQLKDEFPLQLEQARARVKEIEAQLRQQEIRLSYTRIYAPIDGVVSDITAQEGETIVTGLQVANLVTVLDPTRLELWIYVDETDVGRVKIGQQVEYYVDSYPGKIFTGTVEKVYPQPEVKDNIVYYLAIVKVKKDDAAFLRPEMTAYVKIVYRERKNVLVVPNAAVKFEEGQQVIYLVSGPRNEKAEKTVVTIGARGEEETEILSGVKEGELAATKIILPVNTRPEPKRMH